MFTYSKYQMAVSFLALNRALKRRLINQIIATKTVSPDDEAKLDLIDSRIDELTDRVEDLEAQALREGVFLEESVKAINDARR